MPAEIVTAEFCADYWSTFHVPKGVRDPVGFYTVTFDGGAGAALCDCRAFFYAPRDNKTCKHINFCFKHGCFWNPQWYEGGDRTIRPYRKTKNTIPKSRCPGCKGRTVAVRIAI
jgi:hypothetical protein